MFHLLRLVIVLTFFWISTSGKAKQQKAVWIASFLFAVQQVGSKWAHPWARGHLGIVFDAHD